jgi:hypothetical protein
MRRSLLVSLVLVSIAARPARGQSIKLADVAGTWNDKAMVGPRDSVVSTSVITATADGKGWTLKFPNRDPLPERVVAVGGDSIVTEVGPYPSILRPGETVTLLRSVTHYKGNVFHGTFEARYSSGEVLRGKTEGQRTK